MNNDKYERVATVAQRIKEAIEVRQMKQVELSEKTGLSAGMISSYLSGKFEPKSNAIGKMAKVLNVSPAWLCGFDVSMELPSYDKQNSILTIPFVSQRVSAGPGQEYLSEESLEIRSIDILAPMLHGTTDRKKLEAVEVRGDSMTGAHIYSGDIVIFQRALVASEGIYVISFGGDVLVKRLSFRKDTTSQTVRIISANPDYPTETVEADAVHILGKVVGWIHAEPV